MASAEMMTARTFRMKSMTTIAANNAPNSSVLFERCDRRVDEARVVPDDGDCHGRERALDLRAPPGHPRSRRRCSLPLHGGCDHHCRSVPTTRRWWAAGSVFCAPMSRCGSAFRPWWRPRCYEISEASTRRVCAGATDLSPARRAPDFHVLGDHASRTWLSDNHRS